MLRFQPLNPIPSLTPFLTPSSPCSCTANLQQGWPKLVNSIFFTTANGSIAIGIYAPASAMINGVAVSIATVRRRRRVVESKAQFCSFPPPPQ